MAQPFSQIPDGVFESGQHRETLSITLPDGREALLPVTGVSDVSEEAQLFCSGLYKHQSNASASVFIAECLDRVQEAAAVAAKDQPHQQTPKASDPSNRPAQGDIVLRIPVETSGRTLAMELRRFETRAEAASRFLHRFSIPFVSDSGQDTVALLSDELERRCHAMEVWELHIAVNEHRTAVLRLASTEPTQGIAQIFCEQDRFALKGDELIQCMDQARQIIDGQRSNFTSNQFSHKHGAPLFSIPATLGSMSTKINFFEGDSPLLAADQFCRENWEQIEKDAPNVEVSDCVAMLNQTLTQVLSSMQHP